MRFRRYGNTGRTVLVLHGGPGAVGYMAPVARGLQGAFAVLEPFQRRSGDVPLTVARHIADLRAFVHDHCSGAPPALVGSSWGAMLALAFAAAHPDVAGPIVLIGCGTFDEAARTQMHATIERRGGGEVQQLDKANPDAALQALAKGLLPYYSHDLVTSDLEIEAVDARGNHETWDDMVRLQHDGVYPATFAAIDSPVLMLHGTVDPHPGTMIRDSLIPHIPHLEYREWEQCGHYPWLERAVHQEFFAVVLDWLNPHCR